VDLEKKVTEAVSRNIHPDNIDLEDDDGISGFVVPAQFRGMSAIDRQILIHNALHHSSVKLSKGEFRQMLAIAAWTPAEYEAVDHEGRGSRR
jgi:hypothetical protein